MMTNEQVEKKAIDTLEGLLPVLAGVARDLYHVGNERDSRRIAKAIEELNKVRASLE